MTSGDVPVVLLPGMNCTARLWGPVLPALGDRAIVRAELRGETLEQCVGHLLETLPDRVALVGLSLGGILGLALSRTAPERVERLFLLDTTARPPTAEQREGFARQRRRLAAGTGAREVQEELLDVLVHPRHRPRLTDEVLAMGEETGARRLRQQYGIQSTRRDEREHLPRLEVPVSIVAGRDDALCPPDRHEEIAALVPGARLRLLPDTGHLSPLESPLEVAEELSAWLGR